MMRARRVLASVIVTVTGLVIGGCSSDLQYETQWHPSDVLAVVSRDDGGLVLVGVDPATGAVHALSPLDVAQVDPNIAREASVLRGDGQVWLVVSDGGGRGTLYSVNFGGRSLDHKADLTGGRLPIWSGGRLGVVDGTTQTGFQLHEYVLPGGTSTGQHPLSVTPVASSGPCLVGASFGDQSRVLLYSAAADAAAAPHDLGTGIPGGVACAHGVAVVSVATSAAVTSAQQLPPGDSIVVARNGQARTIKVGSRPTQVAIDEGGLTAAVRVETDTGQAVAIVDLSAGTVTRTLSVPGGSEITGMALRGDSLVAFTDDQVLVLTLDGERQLQAKLPGRPSVGLPG